MDHALAVCTARCLIAQLHIVRKRIRSACYFVLWKLLGRTGFDGLQLLSLRQPWGQGCTGGHFLDGVLERVRVWEVWGAGLLSISVSLLRPTQFRPEPGSNPITTTVTVLNKILFGLLKFYFTLKKRT